MAIDLSDLIESVRREVNAPGLDQLTDATDSDYLGNLQDAFWETVLDGVITGYTESDGIVSPTSGTTELSRELQQLVVFYAGFRIIRNQLRNMKTRFRAASGTNEYEVEQAASLLKGILDDMTKRRTLILERIARAEPVRTHYINAVIARHNSIAYGDEYFWG